MLYCLNCQKDVSPADAKFFMGSAFGCPTCFLMAERLRERIRRTLNALLLMSDEKIRVDFIEGKLNFQMDSDQEIPKDVVLKAIVQLQEIEDARRNRTDARDSKD